VSPGPAAIIGIGSPKGQTASLRSHRCCSSLSARHDGTVIPL
jgi:hypothetical protein